MQATVLIGFFAACSAFVAPASPLQTVQRASISAASPVMSADETSTRRAFIGSLVLGAALPASAFIPGLTGPGFQVQTKKPTKKTWDGIRDTSSFWSSKGIMDSVPKVKGIITPKTPVK